MKTLIKDWRIHVVCLVMVLIAEFIGNKRFDLGITAFTLFPMLYALILGAILGGFKAFPMEMMEAASDYINISVLLLCAKTGSTVGPNINAVLTAGAPLILQEFGNLATAALAIPIGIYVFRMGRAVVGSSFSISREGSLAIIGSKYGLDSEEGIGVMGGYITGTVLGTLFCGIMVSLLANGNIFHPYALAMACGTGSASMMSAQLAAVIDAHPEMEQQLTAYAAASNMLTGVDGLYMSLFIALPMSNALYKLFTKGNKNYKDGQPLPKEKKAKA